MVMAGTTTAVIETKAQKPLGEIKKVSPDYAGLTFLIFKAFDPSP